MKNLVKIRKELERIFNIPVVKLENLHLKQKLTKVETTHQDDLNMIEFYKTNYENQRDRTIKTEKNLLHEKDLHEITKASLQQAHQIIKEFKEK